MSLVSALKAKLGILDADIEKVLTAAEPELQALAKSEAATMLKGLLNELPALATVITPALTGAGLPASAATGLVSAASSWLATAIAKVTAPVTPAASPASTPSVSTTSATKPAS